MQHKRKSGLGHHAGRHTAKLKLAAVLLVLGGAGFLLATDIPAPQHPVEKELDSNSFLGAKP